MKKLLFLFTLLIVSIAAVAQEPTAPQLEYVMQLRVLIDTPYAVGDTPHGKRIIIPITGGTFEGPRLRGTVLPGGADYQLVAPDGKRTELEAIYCIRTDDGSTIHVRNRGIIASVDNSFYFKAAPQFEAPAGSPYSWLNNAIFVCQPDPSSLQGGIILNVWKVK